MVLHKIVNGVKVDLTPEEEEKTKNEWAKNKIKADAKRKEREAKRLATEKVVEKLLEGLTDEEKALVKPRLMR